MQWFNARQAAFVEKQSKALEAQESKQAVKEEKGIGMANGQAKETAKHGKVLRAVLVRA